MPSPRKRKNWIGNVRDAWKPWLPLDERTINWLSGGTLLLLSLILILLLTGCRKCPQCPAQRPPTVVTIDEKCMEPLPPEISTWAVAAKLPSPDNPDDRNSNTTLTPQKVRSIAIFIENLVSYVEIQLARCGRIRE